MMATVGFVLAQIFGSIALILMVISLQKHTYKDLLKIQLTANVLCVFQYLAPVSLVEASGAAVALIRNRHQKIRKIRPKTHKQTRRKRK